MTRIGDGSRFARRLAFVIVALCVVGAGPAAGDSPTHKLVTPGPYKVVCTTGMVGDIVREVAGDRAHIEVLIGAGVDPHMYRATRSDLVKLMDADIVFYNGLMLEGKMASALERLAHSKPVIAVADGVERSRLIVPDGHEGHADPHLWMDVSIWKACAAHVRDRLSVLDRANAAGYAERYDAYTGHLDKLHAYAVEASRTVPETSRVLVTAHDAFNYFGRAYGFDVRGIQGISTESEAGIADVNNIIDLLVDRDVRAIFVESSVSDKNVRALVEGAAARGHNVSIGGTLYSDAMGSSGTYEGTYIGMIDHNVTLIVRALGGDAAPAGFQGKLSGGTD